MVPPSVDVESFLLSCSPESSNSTGTPESSSSTGTPIDEGETEAEEAVDIPTTASTAGIFETLVAALQAANLVDDLAEPNGPFTVFAPNDEAFGALPSGLVTCLLEPENSDALTSILTYHVIEGAVTSADLEDGMMPETLNGETLTIALGNDVTINEVVTVITPDVEATNGVIHIIDSGEFALKIRQFCMILISTSALTVCLLVSSSSRTT